MQITDINDFISTATQLLNAPDLILIAVLLANVWLGARRDWSVRCTAYSAVSA